MTADTSWKPFGIKPETWENEPEQGGIKCVNVSLRKPRDPSYRRGSGLITTATVLLGLLAAGLFVVSLAAQYRYIFAEKHQALPAMIEAVGLDVGMAIFSLLALGLAMAGQSARVERALVVACAAGSALMNYAAANGGSPRSVAAYVMPPIFLAIVVDRVVAVVRRHVLGDAGRSAWSVPGRVALYVLRFTLAAPSTFFGLRRQVLVMTPLPGAEAVAAAQPVAELPRPDGAAAPEVATAAASAGDFLPVPLHDGTCANCGRAFEPEAEPEADASQPARPGRHRQGDDSKTSRFLQLVEDRHGPLATIDPAEVSRISSDLAPEVGLHAGSARAALRPLVLAAQNGSSS
jgi:hypothetical protein